MFEIIEVILLLFGLIAGIKETVEAFEWGRKRIQEYQKKKN